MDMQFYIVSICPAQYCQSDAHGFAVLRFSNNFIVYATLNSPDVANATTFFDDRERESE